ncbi:MAG TPA: SH3 domain-containing protein [Fodinibius sp.]|nr:SH3 domain-containing protein [Fodinibius sp.]
MGVLFKRITTALVVVMGLSFSYGCSSSTWEDAQQADSYEAYQRYIEDNPEGEHIETAKSRSDNLYWSSIQSDTTAESVETYLNKFPEGRFKSQAQAKLNKILSGHAAKGRVTGSNVIIRSDHTTESPSAGVVSREGTVVQILEKYNSTNSNEAILKRTTTVTIKGSQQKLSSGKAISVLADLKDSVRASFNTSQFGKAEATINKDAIEAIGGEEWYKIQTRDNITGWIYGKFIQEM